MIKSKLKRTNKKYIFNIIKLSNLPNKKKKLRCNIIGTVYRKKKLIKLKKINIKKINIKLISKGLKKIIKMTLNKNNKYYVFII